MEILLALVGLTIGQVAAPPETAPTPRYDVLVIADRAAWPPLGPWVRHREGQGHRVALAEPPASAGETGRLIAGVAAEHPLTHVLLVGRPAAGPWGLEEDDLPVAPPPPPVDLFRDATASDNPAGKRSAVEEAPRFARLALSEEAQRPLSALSGRAAPAASLSVPTVHVRPRVNVHWGGEPHLATDHPYSDLDGDGLPDLAVGRWPAATPDDVAVLVAKAIDYETGAVAPPPHEAATTVSGFGGPGGDDLDARRRIAIVAGVGGFGPLIDGLLETAARQAITTLIPPDVDVDVAFGNWRSPYCPDPARMPAVSLDGLRGPGLFWTYIGHGHPMRLDSVTVGQSRYPILADLDVVDDPAADPAGAGRPIALMLACYTAAFDFPVPSLAERMVTSKSGPIAAFASSRIAMPFAMNVLGQELIALQFPAPGTLTESADSARPSSSGPGAGRPLADRVGPPSTLGELTVRAKRRLVAPAAGDASRATLMALGRLASPKPKLLEAELAEHLYLFNLIGDPLLVLPRREIVPVAVDQTKPSAGSTIAVRTSGLAPGPVRVEVVSRRDRATTELAGRDGPPGESSAERDAMQAAYEAANDRLFAATTTTFEPAPADGEGTIAVPIPVAASGPCHVRVVQIDGGVLRTGTCDLLVVPARGPR